MLERFFKFRLLSLAIAFVILAGRIEAVSHKALVAPIQNFFSNKDQFTGEGVKKSAVFYKKTKNVPDIFSPFHSSGYFRPSLLHRFLLGRSPSGFPPDGKGDEIFIPPEDFG